MQKDSPFKILGNLKPKHDSDLQEQETNIAATDPQLPTEFYHNTTIT